MPQPDKYVSRSELGWGASPASYANPRDGLCIHYDSVDQNLADKPHSACISYWKATRSFHTGPSRGWADIGYCVDEATEILTGEGWRHHRDLRAGDPVLTLDHTTGTARWSPLLAVNVFPALPRTLVRMEGHGHSSLTTAAHRWPVEHVPAAPSSGPPERRWATSATLAEGDLVPLAAPCADLPAEAKWADPLVSLVATACASPDHDDPAAPRPVRPGDTARVRADLAAVFGPPADGIPGPGSGAWREVPGAAPRFALSAGARAVLAGAAPDGVPGGAFLRSLTRAQLALFLDTALPSGTGPRVPLRRAAADAVQFAAVLAGWATTVRPHAGGWVVERLPDDRLAPGGGAAGVRPVVGTAAHDGPVWCPTTPDSTWLARRDGTVYFTGNSFMACPHGYVLEGRGLFKQQAAQPGGNSTYYSCTLATGPTDEITPDQINAVRQLRQWLMEPESSIAGTVKGHRDFIATSCPGDAAYSLVRNGTFAKAPSDRPEDDMPKHWRYEKDDDQPLPDGAWATLRCTSRGSQTGELYSWLGVDEKDGAYFSATASVRVSGLEAGAEVQGQFFEVARGADGTWQWVGGYKVQSLVHREGAAHLSFLQNGNLAKGRRLRMRVTQHGGGGSAVVDDARIDVLYWER
jgi:hypothetical protein